MPEYIIDKAIPKQVQALQKRGGNFQIASRTVAEIIGKMRLGVDDPLKGIKITKHGESRIKHCVKYDLSGYVRLITIQDNNVFTLKFLGTHEECDSWLDANKGLNLAINKDSKQLVDVMISEDINESDKRLSEDSDFSEGLLYKKLKGHYFEKIADLISYTKISPFLTFESIVSDDDLLDSCLSIDEEEKQTLFFDVFASLRKGDVDAAKNRILEYEAKLKLLTQAEEKEIAEIKSNDQYLKLVDIDPDILQIIINKSDWYEWMIFLHPAQKAVVESDYNGSSRLLGVSGSGKTCVLIHRAVRLAEKYPGEKILIVTLNKSLSKLIEKLVAVLLSNQNKSHLKENIEITSFWELCKNLLMTFDLSGKIAHRIFNITTDKQGETIDEVWEEFYTCKFNNVDADILFPIHQTLLLRKILPQDYLKQEFDWIRSAFAADEREKYLTVERDGRFIPFPVEDRKIILSALKSWEEKMDFVGASDYLGLATALYNYINQIKPTYRSILVDEIQDFGTIELKIIRKLALEQPNDLFICGDIAQQVYNKQHKIRNAGITILPEGYVKILKNYRNSREILEAAYSVFSKNISTEKLNSEDFEILNPEFANFSSPKPFLRKGNDLSHEFKSAYNYLKQLLNTDIKEKGCIAFCGISIFELSAFGSLFNLPVLDGEMDLAVGNIFISDLEQTKGFEFDKMIVINCNQNVFPNVSLPEEEWFREISKLYVAMTRAKKELVISYSQNYSTIFENSLDSFTEDLWTDHVVFQDAADDAVIFTPTLTRTNLSMLGKTYLYEKAAVGLSKEVQQKLIDLVGGKQISGRYGRPEGWATIDKLKFDVNSKRNIPHMVRLFGSNSYKELQEHFQQ